LLLLKKSIYLLYDTQAGENIQGIGGQVPMDKNITPSVNSACPVEFEEYSTGVPLAKRVVN
jgi:hypothetical protein